MSQRVFRSYKEPKREGLSWDERWKGEDRGLIRCWEVGRELREKEPELASRAGNGELPVLGWKGGVEKKTKKGEKYGTLFYLAQWQGLRGNDPRYRSISGTIAYMFQDRHASYLYRRPKEVW